MILFLRIILIMLILNGLGIMCFRTWCSNNVWDAVNEDFPKWAYVLACYIINAVLLAIYFIIL